MNYSKHIDIIITTSDENSLMLKNCLKLVKETTKNAVIKICTANEGFPKAINKQLKKSEAEFVCLLNDDTEPQENWLNWLLYRMNGDSNIGICGSKLLYPDGLIQCAGVGLKKNRWPFLIGNKQKDLPKYNISKEIESLTFASILLRKKMIDKVGFLDEQFFYYFDDTDYCLQAKQAGWKIFYEPESVVYHYESKTISQRQNSRQTYLESEKKYLEKWSNNAIYQRR